MSGIGLSIYISWTDGIGLISFFSSLSLLARWVEDRSLQGRLVVTSSGITAGGDAALAVVAELKGRARAREVATQCEWIWQEDPSNDPFSWSTP